MSSQMKNVPITRKRERSPSPPPGVKSRMSNPNRRKTRDGLTIQQLMSTANTAGIKTERTDTKGDLAHRLGTDTDWVKLSKALAAVGVGTDGIMLVYKLVKAKQSSDQQEIEKEKQKYAK